MPQLPDHDIEPAAPQRDFLAYLWSIPKDETIEFPRATDFPRSSVNTLDQSS
ncbi:MAG TPA: hypothetical protein VNW23_06670 [Opitutaceae bacterium]|nr:hypothetical protein [Opitutaceae bacterium]